MKPVTCEVHEGATCYRGGESGTLWVCPACEIERCSQRRQPAAPPRAATIEALLRLRGDIELVRNNQWSNVRVHDLKGWADDMDTILAVLFSLDPSLDYRSKKGDR